jgi:PncC family amidohydrolase
MNNSTAPADRLPDDVAAQIAAIADDSTHGAAWLSAKALRTVGACAQAAPATDREYLLAQVEACRRALAAARPGMAPLRTWLGRLAGVVEQLATENLEGARLQAAIAQGAADLAQQAERASAAAAARAAALLPAGSVVFTASFSQTVVDAARAAAEQGKLSRLLAAESSGANGRRYGRQVAAALAGVVPVVVVPDAEIADRLAQADRVWLGADTLLRDGSVLNGTPSRALADAAFQTHRPVEIIAESAKRDPEAEPAAPPPPGFDRIPAEAITTIITEAEAADAAATLVAAIAEHLSARGETVAVAESAAGGRIADLLTDRAGSSAWFSGGVVAYSNSSKQRIGDLTAEQLAALGAVSAETAQALAEGARRWFGATWGVGETGIAGPQTGRRSRKPAGLTYVAASGPAGQRVGREVTTGQDDRAANKHAFALAALALLRDALASKEGAQ